MKFFLLTFLLYLVYFNAQAQNIKAIDSLRYIYNTAKHDSTKILALTSIAYEYRNNQPDTSISLAENALQISEKIDFEKGKGWAKNQIARANLTKKDFTKALKLLGEAQTHFEKAQDLKGLARNYNTTGYSFELQDKPSLAIENYDKAIVYYTKINDKPSLATNLTSIADIYYAQNNFPPALEYYKKSLKIKEEIGDKIGVGTTLIDIGDIYYTQSNYPLALDCFQKSLKIREEIGNKKDIGRSIKLIGDVYYRQGNYPLALEYYQKSRKIQEEVGNREGVASALRNIGNIYYRQDNDDLALEYYQNSLKIREELGNKDGVAACLNNIGTIHNDRRNYPLALEYFQKSLKLYEETGNKQGTGYQLDNIGLIYYNQGNYPLAMEYYQKSLKIAEEMGDKQSLTYPLTGLALVSQKQKNYDKSIEYAEMGLKIAQEIQAPREYKDITGTLYETYKLKGDYVKALEYHELYKTMDDSIFNVEKAEKIANLEATAEVERKAKEIEILNKNQEIAKKNEEALRKDAQLQRIETERQKNAKLALEKEAEAKNLLYLATQEKDKRKADSLRSLAQQKQLEVDKHLAQEEKLKAESTARKLEVLKEKEAKEFQQYINYLVLAGLFSLLVFTYFIFRSRQKEKKAKEAIAEQKEEISQMNEELNTTLQVVEEERQKSDKLLLNILPTEVASELKETGKTEVKYFEAVTVLFADVKGFSALATKISPQELITELDATFSKMDEISLRFGLERIKTIGDCYMACGGLPHPNKTHPFDVILAALHIQQWMNEERKKNPDFWQVRLGLHTGEAVAGVIGKTKFAYDIWGSTVNLASRMESGGEVGKVNVTEQTFEIVKEYFEGNFKEEIEAKNIGKVRAYFINRLKPEYSADLLGIEPNERFWEMHQNLKN